MKENTRNIAVGVTVIVALMLLAGMILLFAGLPWFIQRGYEIKIAADTTHDAHPGDGVHLSGMQVGRVTGVQFTDQGRPYEGVTLTARVDPGLVLPGNVEAHFYTRGVVGGAYIELKAGGRALVDPSTGKPLKFFPTDGSLAMPSRHSPGGLIPDELTEAMKSVTRLADNLNSLIAPEPSGQPTAGVPSTAQAATAPAEAPALRGTLEKLNRALDALSAVLGDAENQRNLKAALGSLAKATESATESMAELKKFASQARITAEDLSKLAVDSQQRFNDLADGVMAGAEKVSELMATTNRIATKLELGEGTAGKLLTDPGIYNGLLEATQEMNKLLGELRELVELWKQRGVEIKLK